MNPATRQTIVRTGRFDPAGAPDWHLVPVDIPGRSTPAHHPILLGGG